MPLLAFPPLVTTISPDVAPAGTTTEMLPGAQAATEAVVPLKVTVPEVPKFTPLRITVDPTAPADCESPLMYGTADVVLTTFSVKAPDILCKKLESPLYEARIVWLPTARDETVIDAIPVELLTCADPRTEQSS